MKLTTFNPARKPGARSEQAYDHIKNRLLSGNFPLDNWLSINQFSAQLQISRQPIMDALRRLALEGLIEITPQVGCRPRAYSQQEISDYYHLFSGMEAQVVKLAAQRADAADVAEMRAISAQIAQLIQTPKSSAEDAENYRILNRALHTAFRSGAKSQAIMEIIDRLSDRSDYFVAISDKLIFQERLLTAHEEHEAIIDAIEQGDGEAAAAIMDTHILAIEKRLRDHSE